MYKLMQRSSVTNSLGQTYPDICTSSIYQFSPVATPYKRYVTEEDITRFDLLVYFYYGTCDYTDFILWINKKTHKRELVLGEMIIFPVKNEVESFYTKYYV